MPIFKVDIQKRQDAEYWTNRYLINVPSLSDADDFATSVLVPTERLFHPPTVQFDRVRSSDLIQGSDVFLTRPLSGGGQSNTDGSSPYPLFNTLRLDFTAGQGRPSRKYYRGLLFEGNVNIGQIAPALLELVTGSFDEVLPLGVLCDPQGTLLTEAIAYAPVQMRQLRRGSKRKATSII